MAPWEYFTDAVLRAPTIGSMLMCLVASLVGVVVFLRKESLLGEALSHAAYPGVILGVFAVGLAAGTIAEEGTVAIAVMVGAFCSSLLGLRLIFWLEKRLRLRPDSALCLVLSLFFGVGLTLASQIQFVYTALYRQGQTYLFGQAATMTDWHIGMYALLAATTVLVISCFYKELQMIAFDHTYAQTTTIPVARIDGLFLLLVVSAVVIGLRSVGVVLMSAMLIAPAVTARQYTDKLHRMFVLAAFFGLLSGFLGNYLSVELSQRLTALTGAKRLALPTGPMIILVAAAFALFSLLFAPERGVFLRKGRAALFRYRCMLENILKSIWRLGPDKEVSFQQVAEMQPISLWYVRFLLWRLIRTGWLDRTGPDRYRLNKDGQHRAAKIVRLHRLWEVYLVSYVGMGVERVHRSAEEVEHILTPELEELLTRLLHDPKRDPHQQPIPPRPGV